MRAFRILFEDPDWLKHLLFGAVFTLLSGVLIGLFFIAGYGVRLVRNAQRGEARPLPDWDDLGGLFQDGLGPVGMYLIYGFATPLVPATIAGVIGAAAWAIGSLGPSDGSELGIVVGMLAFYFLLFVFGLVGFVIFPAAFTRMALERRFSAAFEFGEILGYIKRNAGNYLLAVLAYLIASVASQFGLILLCVGIFPAIFWSYVVMSWGLGEAARLDPGRR